MNQLVTFVALVLLGAVNAGIVGPTILGAPGIGLAGIAGIGPVGIAGIGAYGPAGIAGIGAYGPASIAGIARLGAYRTAGIAGLGGIIAPGIAGGIISPGIIAPGIAASGVIAATQGGGNAIAVPGSSWGPNGADPSTASVLAGPSVVLRGSSATLVASTGAVKGQANGGANIAGIPVAPSAAGINVPAAAKAILPLGPIAPAAAICLWC